MFHNLLKLARYPRAGILLLVFTAPAVTAFAKPLVPPEDPTQSITYWRQHTLSPDKDSLAAMAQGVFDVLLRAWDSSRLEPGLYVVKSSAGPWAASLADGNILLSRAAIETCLKFGKHRAEHLLAFVLAHELAHQRSDDLWHQRFFRLIGNQGQDVKKLMLKELQTDRKIWANVGQKETQADHDGLIMMSSVGYDPYQVLDKKDFFTVWVENIWQASCASTQQGGANAKACQQARSRAMRAHAQLTAVATQSTLYEMGVQSFIAGQYKMARRYLTAYGRDYTNRAVLTALGLSHFAEALQSYQQLVEEYGLRQPAWYYPMLLDANAMMVPDKPDNPQTGKRAAVKEAMARIRRNMQASLEQSVNYYEKAIKLEPNYARSYLLLAFSYLLDNNTYMVRGIIQGKYIPLFGQDKAVDLILAMTSAMEGRVDESEKAFAQLLEAVNKPLSRSVIPADLLVYSTYYNSVAYAKHLGKHDRVTALWKQLADSARSRGKAVLFQMAVGQLTRQLPANYSPDTAPNIKGLRLGDQLSLKGSRPRTNLMSDLWIEGEQFHVYRLNDGSRYVVDTRKRLVNAWQESGRARLYQGIATGDKAERAFKTLGIPDRQLHMVSGEYLAYDAHGLAIHLEHNKVAGWFLYHPR